MYKQTRVHLGQSGVDVTVNEEGRWVMEGMLLVSGEGLMAPGQIIGLCG